MKIAIQGHSTRGKEVIQVLESLGGIKLMDHKGCCNEYFYYISGDDNTIAWTCIRPQYTNVFTLEEFEKEFPFKIGDKVTDHEGDVAIITGFAYIEEKLGYSLQYENGRGTATSGILKPYKEMKEKRNITLTIDKAKEWYKKGGELKEIALQAFTEEELNPLPRSWEEFCKNNPIQDHEAFINYANGYITMCKECAGSGLGIWTRKPEKDRCKCVSQKSAEAHLAMMQLEQLRNCYNNSCNDTNQIAIINNNGNIELYVNPPFNCFLTFKNHSLAREFFSNFKEIIEIAKELI